MKLKDWLDNRHTKEEQNNLTVLYCSGKGITSLEGIEQLDKLEYLNCSNNKLISLKGIEQLVNLEYLHCNNNKITSLKGIEKLVKLERLDCSHNPLPYSDLKNFSKIKLEVIKEVRQYKIQKMFLL